MKKVALISIVQDADGYHATIDVAGHLLTSGPWTTLTALLAHAADLVSESSSNANLNALRDVLAQPDDSRRYVP